jgi:hypothetical protein
MKFEKFFKSVGTHGLIVKKSEKESWLLCGGVGMRIPDGVNNLGVSVEPERLFDIIVNSEPEDDFLTLFDAIVTNPEGKASDIIRVFETDIGDRVGIWNSDYGLLEKKDKLTYLEIEAEDPEKEGETIVSKIMVVRDHTGEAVGFITGSDRI